MLTHVTQMFYWCDNSKQEDTWVWSHFTCNTLQMSTHINSILNLTIVCYHLDEYSRFWKEGGLNLDLEANIRSNAIFSYTLQQRFVKIKLLAYSLNEKKSSKLFLEWAMFFFLFTYFIYCTPTYLRFIKFFWEGILSHIFTKNVYFASFTSIFSFVMVYSYIWSLQTLFHNSYFLIQKTKQTC